MRRRRTEAGWVAVTSSAVRAVRYDSARGELDVRFEDGAEYRYVEVSRSKFRSLLQADSIGGFVNQYIKPYHSTWKISDFPDRKSRTGKDAKSRFTD